MTEQTREADRNQGGTKRDSAAAAAPGLTPATKPARIEAADAIPLEYGTVRNGGAFTGGESPADATDATDEAKHPLDSRQAFGGDGAHYVDPAIAAETQPDGQQRARSNGTAAGEDGFDARAGSRS